VTSDKIVITFRTRLNPGHDQELTELGEKMYGLAASMPGFISYKDFGAADGEFVSIVEFDNADNLARWRNHPDHLAAQELGKRVYFSWYQIQVCQVIREYSHPNGNQ
jgi:heme-degrading monooxygenase HmoA